MSYGLSALLELLSQTRRQLSFRLVIRSESPDKLLLPVPEPSQLRFVNKATLRESECYCGSMETALGWDGLLLDSNEAETLLLNVVPVAHSSVYDPPDNEDSEGSDVWGPGFDLPSGDYLAWFQLTVDRSYSCPHSHRYFSDLIVFAEEAGAKVWVGDIMSNRLQIRRE